MRKKLLCAILLSSLALGTVSASAEEEMITVTVGIYDYNAVEYGATGASGDGVILDNYQVTVPAGTTAVEALKQALTDNDIEADIQASSYGTYIAGIDGVSAYGFPNNTPDYSGWAFEYNSDNYTNWGVDTVGAAGDGVVSDGDVLKFDYQIYMYQDLNDPVFPTIKTLSIGDQDFTMQLGTATYDDSTYSYSFTYASSDAEITGSGTEADPYVITVDLGEIDSTVQDVAIETTAYFTANVEASHDFSEDLTFTVSPAELPDKLAYYTVKADYTLAEEDEDEDSEPTGVPMAVVPAGIALAAAALVITRKKR